MAPVARFYFLFFQRKQIISTENVDRLCSLDLSEANSKFARTYLFWVLKKKGGKRKEEGVFTRIRAVAS